MVVSTILTVYCAFYFAAQLTENMPEEAHVLKVDPKKIIAEISFSSSGKEPAHWK